MLQPPCASGPDGGGGGGSGGGGSGGGGGSSGGLSVDLLVPAAGLLAAALLVGPLVGGTTFSIGLAVVATGVAAVTGVLDKISKTFALSLPSAAGAVVAGTFGLLLVPIFLKLVLVLAAGFTLFSFLFGAGFTSAFSPTDSVEAKDAIIDVTDDARTVDD